MKDFSKLINDPIYKQAVKDWEYAQSEKEKAVKWEYSTWKKIVEMEERYKLDNNIND
jgi:hypothetical protein